MYILAASIACFGVFFKFNLSFLEHESENSDLLNADKKIRIRTEINFLNSVVPKN